MCKGPRSGPFAYRHTRHPEWTAFTPPLWPGIRPALTQRALPFFSEEIFQRRVVEHGIGQQPLQLGVLVLERPQLPGLADVHTAILGLPLVDARIAHAMLAAQIGDRDARLVLFQYPDDLVFGEPASFHLWSSFWARAYFKLD